MHNSDIPPPSYEECFPNVWPNKTNANDRDSILKSWTNENLVDNSSELKDNTDGVNDFRDNVLEEEVIGSMPEFVRGFMELREDPNRTYFKRNIEWPDGQGTYLGEVDHKGRRNGTGRMVWRTRDAYMGDWKSNFMHGHGLMFWGSSGSVYIGGWKQSKQDGLGEYLFGPQSHTPNDVYKGTFRHGEMCDGEYICGRTGHSFRGCFKHNRMHKGKVHFREGGSTDFCL